MSYCIYYILYCKFSGHYVCEEREDCWQYTDQDSATRFDSLEEAAKVKTKLEADGFPPLTILKMKQTTEIISIIQMDETAEG